MLVEIQALTVRLSIGRDPAPRRGRLGQRAAGDDFGGAGGALWAVVFNCEVYLNIAGGYRISDPAADMAVAAALVSALSERTLPSDMVLFGEVSLSGEIRPVAHGGLRLKEAAKLGFNQAMVPARLPKGYFDQELSHARQSR